MTPLRIFITVLVALVALYIGWGAYTDFQLGRLNELPPPARPSPVTSEEGVRFADVSVYWIRTFEKRRDTWFPWTKPFSEEVDLAILAAVAGYFGGLLRDVRDKLQTKSRPRFTKSYAGAVLGVLIFLLSFLYPKLFLENDPKLRLSPIIAFCFFCGVFGQEAWKFISKKVESFYNKV